MKTTMQKKTVSKKNDAQSIEIDGTDITQILHRDHLHVTELFFQYSELEENDHEQKNKITKTIVKELFVHAKVEEEIVYPAVRKADKDSADMMDEADTEHHVVKFLLAELSLMKSDDDHFDAKVCVLAELVNHHVQEEEKEIFEALRESDLDLEKMGTQVLVRKQELLKDGVPKKIVVATNSKPASKTKN